MNSFNVLSAIKVNALALSDAGYVDEALPYIAPLKNLFNDLEKSIKDEKSAPDAGTSETAKENTSSEEYTKFKELSTKWPLGSLVECPDGKGSVYGYTGGKLILQFVVDSIGFYDPAVCMRVLNRND